LSTGGVVGSTIVLIVVAGITAGLWLNLLMWIPSLLLGMMRDEETAYVIVSALTMLIAAGTVFLVGDLAIGLPWYAAVIAGLVVGMTSYARPNPAHPAHPANDYYNPNY
jgi:hypothetical protein